MTPGQMQVDRGLLQVTMTQQQLDGSQVGTSFQQMGREAVPQSVRMNVLVCQTSAFGSLLQASQSTLVVMGRLPVCHRFPGNSQFVGLRRKPRQ